MNTYWNVDKVDTRKDYIVFDDMDFDHFICWQAFFGKSLTIYGSSVNNDITYIRCAARVRGHG